MANYEKTLSALSVQITSSGSGATRELTALTSFTIGTKTWEITLPSMMHDDIRRLLKQIVHAVDTDQQRATLGEGGSFTIVLL